MNDIGGYHSRPVAVGPWGELLPHLRASHDSGPKSKQQRHRGPSGFNVNHVEAKECDWTFIACVIMYIYQLVHGICLYGANSA